MKAPVGVPASLYARRHRTDLRFMDGREAPAKSPMLFSGAPAACASANSSGIIHSIRRPLALVR